ncbi:MAG TPA: type II toxin-antitoxin system HicB family antitoxin [Ignavibacteria bacterium]|nr:type II toxin-antitoxin system HicB family antitoxin [Ignavibacteria bacterium]
MKNLNYRTLFRKEPEGGYTVIVPSLPGCVTYGDTIEDSMEKVKEAIELYIVAAQELGEDIPTEENVLEYNVSIVTP